MRQAVEPSVEEILESIKKVIARDNRAESAQARARREAPVAAPAAPRSAPRPADVLDLAEEDAQVLLAEDDDDDGHEGHAMTDEDAAPLLPEAAAVSMRDSLAALSVLAQPGVQPQIVRSGETSLEGMVRDMLRPMLSEWLEKNLPGMVERMVAAEITRIVGKKG